MNVNAVVFLDFDDVISISKIFKGSAVVRALQKNDPDFNLELWAKIFDPTLYENLRALHDEFTPQYVISSSWASFLDRRQIVELFKRTGLDFVAESLHEDWRTPRKKGSERADEIAAWLAAHDADAPHTFLILDDLISGASLKGSTLEPFAVLCEQWKGFNYPKLRTAQKILRTQLASNTAGSKDHE